MRAIQLNSSRASLSIISSMILSEHAIERVEYGIRNVIGLHYLFSDIEAGNIVCYSVFEQDKPIGIAWGKIENKVWTVHAVFDRQKNTQKALSLIEDKIVPQYNLTRVTAYIPLKNKAALFMWGRFGAKRQGIASGAFQDGINKFIDCQIMAKEYV